MSTAIDSGTAGRKAAAATDQVTAIVLDRPVSNRWIVALAAAATATAVFIGALGYLFATGVGIWGINIPVAWGFAITNYVWWIGIAMAGTFISAALLLARQPWRNSVSRFAETMTVISLAIAGLFPIMHLGRPWFAYWLVPYPNVMQLWPQWRSALVWDFVAIACYVVVSLGIWYLGLLPDLASLRDRARRRGAQVFYGLLALGWRGEARHWQRHQSASRLLAGFAVPLVFMVHSMVALDFSEGISPGWHTTLFPPFFVAGALFSGFAVVLALALFLRGIYELHAFITDTDLDRLARMLVALSLFMAYSYALEVFGGLYTGNPDELGMLSERMSGPYAPLYWATLVLNAALPQVLWSRLLRERKPVLLVVSLGVIIGMWLERFVLVVTTLRRGFLASDRGMFYPTAWDWVHLLGSIGLCALLFLLFVRLLPLLPLFEIRKRIFEEG